MTGLSGKCSSCLFHYSYSLLLVQNPVGSQRLDRAKITFPKCISSTFSYTARLHCQGSLAVGVIVLQIWGLRVVSREDRVHLAACLQNLPCTTACGLSPSRDFSRMEKGVWAPVLLKEESHLLIKTFALLYKWGNFYCVKSLRFQGLSDYQHNAPRVTLTNRVGIIYTKASS